VSRIADPEVLDLLTRLVEKSLVVYEEDEQGRGRFWLLETVRQYARERLPADPDSDTLRRRHANCYLLLAAAIRKGPDFVLAATQVYLLALATIPGGGRAANGLGGSSCHQPPFRIAARSTRGKVRRLQNLQAVFVVPLPALWIPAAV